MNPTRISASVVLTVFVLAPVACSQGDSQSGACGDTRTEVTMRLTSTAFADSSRIPTRHTCEGENLSPALQWTGVPEGSKSIALVCHDPDAPMGTWVHWVLYSIPPTLASLAEGIPATDTLSNGARHGTSSFKRPGYGGPCPPKGHGTHRYFFTLYALDVTLDLAPGVDKQRLLDAMEAHFLATTQLMGTYSRQ